MRISFLAFISILIFSSTSLSAKSEGSNELTDSLNVYLLKELNRVRHELNLDSLSDNETLFKAAQLKAAAMAEDEKASLEPGETAQRLKKFGGTNKTDELVIGINIGKKKDFDAMKELAKTIADKWKSGKKELPVLSNATYVYASVSSFTDEPGKKVYVSVVFGGFDSFNKGAKKKKELKVPYNKKGKKLQKPTEKGCKNCDKFKDYIGLEKGLYVKDGKVYLKYNDVKALKKLLKKPTDGFAVDIVQKAQYSKKDYNIYDNNLMTKGIMLKKMNTDKIFSSNLALDEKGKGNNLEICFGKFPKKLKKLQANEYELNLLVIQDNKVCKTLTPSYLEEGDQASNTPLEMLLMPDSDAYMKPKYVVEAEDAILNFIIPFEKNKYDYKPEDIQPILSAMQEPDYLVQGLYVYAYSSIEGDSVSNSALQRKRAESIIEAFKKMQGGKAITTSVKTSDSWDLFKMEMEGGKYDELTKMPKKKAIAEINNKGLATELEPVLAKQRFAKVVMDITYDIKGDKEQKYVAAQFNKAVKASNIKLAEKIQYFMEEKVRKKEYTPAALSLMQIPKDAKYSALLNNQVVYRWQANNKFVNEEDASALQEITRLDPANSYASFNEIFAKIKLNQVGDAKERAQLQNRIDQLYLSKIPKKLVDGLNTEYQFAVMAATDTLPEAAAIQQACIDKIKSFYNFKESTWQNNLKLAYVFMRFQDFKYAANLLEPFVNNAKVDEQLLYTYVSCCAQVPEKTKSKAFVTAMRKIKAADAQRFCVLVGTPNLSFQVLDNPMVKEIYLDAGCK